MSLLMFYLEPERVWIVTDTLSTTVDGEPTMFVSKCFVVPHLSMAIASVGIAKVASEWHSLLQTSMLSRDIDMVDLHATKVLRELDASLDLPSGDRYTSTIYHFGWSYDDNAYVRYVYRSKSDYASERYEAGFGINPPPPDSDVALPTSLDEIVDLSVRIRAAEDAKPASERAYIGGELMITLLEGRGSTVRSIHTFDDHDDHWRQMNARMRATG